jgi:hypothetical protein
MDLAVSFWIIIMIFAIALSFVLVKSIIKALMFSLIIITLILGVGAFFVIKDAIDIKDNFMENEKLMVLKDGDNVLAAFTFKNLSMQKEVLSPLDAKGILQIEASIRKNDYSQLKDVYYKIAVFNYSAFNSSLSKGLRIAFGNDEIILTGDEVKKIFNSDSPLDTLSSMSSNAKNIDTSRLTSSNQAKSYLFAYMTASMIKNDGILEMIPKIKSGEIYIYPNTAIIKGIRLLPYSFISKFTDKLQNKVKSEI